MEIIPFNYIRILGDWTDFDDFINKLDRQGTDFEFIKGRLARMRYRGHTDWFYCQFWEICDNTVVVAMVEEVYKYLKGFDLNGVKFVKCFAGKRIKTERIYFHYDGSKVSDAEIAKANMLGLLGRC